MIGLRFDGSPLALLGFWRGFKIPKVTSLGVSPVSAMEL